MLDRALIQIHAKLRTGIRTGARTPAACGTRTQNSAVISPHLRDAARMMHRIPVLRSGDADGRTESAKERRWTRTQSDVPIITETGKAAWPTLNASSRKISARTIDSTQYDEVFSILTQFFCEAHVCMGIVLIIILLFSSLARRAFLEPDFPWTFEPRRDSESVFRFYRN